MIVKQVVAALVVAAAVPSFAQSKPKPSAPTLGNARASGSDAGAVPGTTQVPSATPVPPANPAPLDAGTAAPTGGMGGAVAPSAPALPPRPPEMDQLRLFAGAWRCEGTAPANALGPARKYQAVANVTPVLDGRWYEIRYEQRVGKENPVPQKLHMTWGYDSGAKQFHRTAHSNYGSLDVGTSPGWQGDTLLWSGEAATAMGKLPFRNTVVRRTLKELTLSTDLQVGGQWLSMGSDTCRR